jgi:hypothetical protein
MNQRSYFLKLTWHNSSSKVFCFVSVSKQSQPYRTKGITKLCINSVSLVFAYFVQDNLSRGNVGAIHVLQQVAIPGRFNFIKTDLSDLEDVSYSQLFVLYSCGLRVCVHVPKSLKQCDMVLYGQSWVSSYCFIWEQWLCSVPWSMVCSDGTAQCDWKKLKSVDTASSYLFL